jgi:sensor c-di-GMP phosphodiesterase-like protein
MVKREFLRAPETLVVLLAGLLPIVLSVALSWRAADTELRGQLDAATEVAVADADRFLGRIEEGLRERDALIGAACDTSTVHDLDRLTYDTPLIRTVGLFDAAGHLYCTSRGTANVGISSSMDTARRGDVVIRVGRSATMGTTALIVEVRREDEAGIGAVADLSLFDQLATPPAFGDQGALCVVLGGATSLRTAGRPIGSLTGPLISSSRRSRKFDVTAMVAVPRKVMWSIFRGMLGLYGAAGLALSAAFVWLTLRGFANRQSLTRGLRSALRRRQFEVHYHPVIDIQNDRCVGAEALIRWRHPGRGLIRPDLFIPVAEETGFIIPITRWLMNRVRDDFEGMALPREFHLAINLAPVQFRDRTIVDDIRAIFSGRNLSPAMLVLEATERFPIDDAGRKVIDALRTMGPGIALDDFGTGHSGLAYLQKFHGDYLKIDKSFVQTIGTDAVTRTVVDSIINLARELDMEIIAEGVETAAQLDYLRDRGVPFAQGYLFAQPMPIAEFKAYLSSHAGPEATESHRDAIPLRAAGARA